MTGCRRCGGCCTAYPCGLSWLLFRPDEPDDLEAPPLVCPALFFDGEKASCGLVDNPLAYVAGSTDTERLLTFLVHEHLAIGDGCGAMSPDQKRTIRRMVQSVKTKREGGDW